MPRQYFSTDEIVLISAETRPATGTQNPIKSSMAWLYLFRNDELGYFRGVMKTNNDSFFVEPVDPQHEARAMVLVVVCRLFIWMAEGPTLEERGLRATVALYCVRPDLINQATLEEVGNLSGRSRQAVHQLADSFRLTTGLSR